MKPRYWSGRPGSGVPTPGAGATSVEPSAKNQFCDDALTPSASCAPLTMPTSKLLMKYMGRSATNTSSDTSCAETPVNVRCLDDVRSSTSYTATVLRWPVGTSTTWDLVPCETPAGSSSW